MVSEIEVKVKSNLDNEIKKAKKLVDLLERANELIDSLGNRKIEVTLDSSSITQNLKAKHSQEKHLQFGQQI